MEIQQLRHLLAAATFGNLQKAADSSCISQSGLSRSIKSLEQRLGVPLLVRGPRGVQPTEYGLSVLRRAKVIMNEVQRSVDEVRAIEQARIGEVTLGITQNYTSYLVPELLLQLNLDRPELRISVISDGFSELLERIRAEEIDFAFGLIGAVQRADDIIIAPLREHRSRIIASRHHRLAAQGSASLEDLSEARWIMLSSGSVQRSFASYFERRGLPIPTQIIRANSVTLIRRLITEMDALSFLPEDVVSAEIEAGSVVVIESASLLAHSQVGLFFRDGGLLTPQARFVMDRFESVMASRADKIG